MNYSRVFVPTANFAKKKPASRGNAAVPAYPVTVPQYQPPQQPYPMPVQPDRGPTLGKALGRAGLATLGGGAIGLVGGAAAAPFLSQKIVDSPVIQNPIVQSAFGLGKAAVKTAGAGYDQLGQAFAESNGLNPHMMEQAADYLDPNSLAGLGLTVGIPVVTGAGLGLASGVASLGKSAYQKWLK